jgi:hypothetical protein
VSLDGLNEAMIKLEEYKKAIEDVMARESLKQEISSDVVVVFKRYNKMFKESDKKEAGTYGSEWRKTLKRKIRDMEKGEADIKDTGIDKNVRKESTNSIKETSKPSFKFGIEGVDDSQEDSKSPDMKTQQKHDVNDGDAVTPTHASPDSTGNIMSRSQIRKLMEASRNKGEKQEKNKQAEHTEVSVGEGNVEDEYVTVNIMEPPTETEKSLWMYLMRFNELNKAYEKAKTDEEREQAGARTLFE